MKKLVLSIAFVSAMSFSTFASNDGEPCYVYVISHQEGGKVVLSEVFEYDCTKGNRAAVSKFMSTTEENVGQIEVIRFETKAEAQADRANYQDKLKGKR